MGYSVAPTTSSTTTSGTESTGPQTSTGTTADTTSTTTDTTSTTGVLPVCGDGVVEGDEVCDDGINDGSYGGCMADCLSEAEHCGDGVMNGPELCDDGNNDNDDECTTACAPPSCGDGLVQLSEECDGDNLGGADCTTGNATPFTWQAALQRAAEADFAGSSLWRLPNKKELDSLVEQRCYNPAINNRIFSNTPTDKVFWSSSSNADNAGLAWIVNFNNGSLNYYGKDSANYVRLVRGGQ